MSEQQNLNNNAKHQFGDGKQMTFSEKVEFLKNKSQITKKRNMIVEKLIEKLNQKFPTQMRLTFRDNEYLFEHIITLVKEIEIEQTNKFTIDFISWLRDNEYIYKHKYKMYLKSNVNEAKGFTLEELISKFKETYGGNG
jgi:hypothetical protein